MSRCISILIVEYVFKSFKMKYRVLLILVYIACFANPTYAQSDLSKLKLTDKYKISVDTVRVQSVGKDAPKSWIESTAMPWIASIIIAILGLLVNIAIARSTRNTSLEMTETQIKNSTRLAAHQFNATLNSSNRQEWINDVRDCISELITQCNLLNISFQEEPKNKDREKEIHQKVTLYRNKLRLFLSTEIEQHKMFLDELREFINILDRHFLNSRNPVEDYDNIAFARKSDSVIELGRALLYFEWHKIQNVRFE
jgi:hypothetical protein